MTTQANESIEVVPSITGKQALGFLASRGVNDPACPVCTRIAWTIMEDRENRGFPLPSQSATGGVGPKTFPVLAFVCANCGYTWFMARRIVEDWLGGNENGK